MLLTKMLTLFVLSAQPEIASVETPVVSDVMESPTVTVRHSANLFDDELRETLADLLKASFGVDTKFTLDVGTTDVLDVSTEAEGVDLDKVSEYVHRYVWRDHCDD